MIDISVKEIAPLKKNPSLHCVSDDKIFIDYTLCKWW